MSLCRAGLACALAVVAGSAFAQFGGAQDPDWKESAVPPPPAFNAGKLVPVEVGAFSSLSFGIDPATLTLTPEGIVRYVVVASSRTGAMNAMYEGIRCASGEYKVYARYNTGSGWNPVTEPSWHSLYAPSPSRHTLSIARAGVCRGNAPNLSTERIVKDLRNPVDRKFESP
jgi:hypothetical protein